MIRKTENGFVISSKGTWRPGLYADERTARYAFRFDDTTLQRLQDEKGDKAIEFADLQKVRQL